MIQVGDAQRGKKMTKTQSIAMATEGIHTTSSDYTYPITGSVVSNAITGTITSLSITGEVT